MNSPSNSNSKHSSSPVQMHRQATVALNWDKTKKQNNQTQNTDNNSASDNADIARYCSTVIYRRPYLEWKNIGYQTQIKL